MGRVCNGPRVQWAEFVMGRDVPEPIQAVMRLGSGFGMKMKITVIKSVFLC